MNLSNVKGKSESLNWIQVFFFIASLNELFQYGCIQRSGNTYFTRGCAEHPIPIDDEILSKDEFSR